MNIKLIFITIFSGVWSLIGIIFFIIGVFLLKNRKKKEMECTSKTYGKVKDIVRHKGYSKTDREYDITWYPVFEYNIGELKFIKESIYGSSQSKYAIGQDVEIYYDPEDYHNFYIPGENIQKMIGTIFTIIGIVAIIISILATILVMVL